MRRIAIAAGVLALAGVLVASVGAGTRSAAGKNIGNAKAGFASAKTKCKSGSVPAVVGGKAVCLKAGQKCRARYEAIYKKKGFHCAKGRLQKAAKPTPSISIDDASLTEGNSGTTPMTFTVSLSSAASKTVSVDYATADGTATAPSDYAAASGTLSFNPGEKVKTIQVSVVGDTAIEQNETFAVALSNPVNATIANGSATGTILNDDTQVPVTAGSWKGATQNGDYVFFTVLSDRTLTGFRVNNVREDCSPGGIYLTGSINWTDNIWTIGADGSFAAKGDWSGSDVVGDVEYTKEHEEVSGTLNGTSATGTLLISDELNYHGVHYSCSTGQKTWSATLQG